AVAERTLGQGHLGEEVAIRGPSSGEGLERRVVVEPYRRKAIVETREGERSGAGWRPGAKIEGERSPLWAEQTGRMSGPGMFARSIFATRKEGQRSLADVAF